MVGVVYSEIFETDLSERVHDARLHHFVRGLSLVRGGGKSTKIRSIRLKYFGWLRKKCRNPTRDVNSASNGVVKECTRAGTGLFFGRCGVRLVGVVWSCIGISVRRGQGLVVAAVVAGSG